MRSTLFGSTGVVVLKLAASIPSTNTFISPPLTSVLAPRTENPVPTGDGEVAEDVGFDSVWVTDHLLFRFPPRDDQGLWECWSLLSALGAVTNRVEIGPLVSCTSYRNPALLAKIADTVDEISDGRLILGLGAGWHEPEYKSFGYPFDHRISRFEEALTIIHGLLRNGAIDFDGKYYQARDCELRPRGPRKNGPPILIGSTGERMLGLVAKYADHWNAWGRNNPDEIPADRERSTPLALRPAAIRRP